jgi:protein tyrosine phosphatase (PTP) superfamily phosphohydrolase (DUF442 family)
VIRAFAACIAVVLATAAHAQSAPENFVQWRKGLASSAQPTRDWLRTAKEKGYDVVVNLAPPQVHGSLPDEGGIVGATGVTYVSIPVDFQHPAAEDFRFFSEVLKANASRNVLVHCQVNLRGSSFTFLYRVLQENADIGEAREKLLGVWTPEGVWKRFIEDTLKASGKSADLL